MDFGFEERQSVRYRGGRHPLASVITDIRVRAIPGFRDEVQRATARAAEYGQQAAIELAPRGGPHNPFDKKPSRKQLRDAIEVATESTGPRSSRTAAIYAPGGAGGGGSWQTRIFINTDDAPHAAYLFSGTGKYGPKGVPIEYGKQIRFFWWRKKKMVETWSIQGMKPNTIWWGFARMEMERDLERRLKHIRSFGVNNVNG